MRYHDIDRGIRRPSNIALLRDCTISCTNTRFNTRVAHRYRPNTQTMQTGDNYLSDHHLKDTYIGPVGDRVPSRLPTHQHTNTGIVWSILCPLNILPVQAVVLLTYLLTYLLGSSDHWVYQSPFTMNEWMKVQWFKVRSKTDLESAKSNIPCKQI